MMGKEKVKGKGMEKLGLCGFLFCAWLNIIGWFIADVETDADGFFLSYIGTCLFVFHS